MMRKKAIRAILLTFSLTISLITAPSAPALSFNTIPATKWGYIYGSGKTANLNSAPPQQNAEAGPAKSKWNIDFKDVPEETKVAFQYAVDIWASYFESSVPVEVEAYWEPSNINGVLGSARPGDYFNAFDGAPDSDLWYPSALANKLAKKDLAPNKPDIVLRFNSNALWHLATDGKPGRFSYDLSSTVLHEIGHGLGFLSNAEYDPYFGTGYIIQPTPYDAYVELPDGRRFTDFCARSVDLGKAMTSPLNWSGPLAIKANNGTKPKLYAPKTYEEGSSITHLDEATYKSSGTDSIMTPVLDSGEVFRSPGPIALAMLDDMLQKPPVTKAQSLPSKPINVKALVGDKYALVTFDSPSCRRIDRVTGYKITINPSGETRSFTSSPARISGLKNGVSYTFSVTAENANGKSDQVTSNEVTLQASAATKTIDPKADAKYLATGTYKNNSVIAYSDAISRKLKLATLNKNKWNITTVDSKSSKNFAGPVSLCVSKTKSAENLHIFYTNMDDKDLRHATFDGKKWRYETVDGNGENIQSYKESQRRRTASDVSVSNACAVTPSGLQVFYRDESQGILLGATLTKAGWIYEIVDGDKQTQGRTTGDVGFSLSAIANGKTVYVIYDSVLTLSSGNYATQGETRLAKRNTIYPEDWDYQTLDGPDSGVAVAGYDVVLAKSGTKVAAAWLSASGNRLPDPDQIKFLIIDEDELPKSATTEEFGTPGWPIAIDNKGLIFGCEKRLCSMGSSGTTAKLLNGALLDGVKESATITINEVRYAVTSLNKKLVLVKL
ncbi:MAG: fibronectin [Candidatus Nanopelagicaceae bacterium]|nr:fibronectin [Candidatus Nanopelagicaceae bacterium]